jgi:F-type H+-transporting ATPase subunit delta
LAAYSDTMNNPRLAGRYAKSLLDLATEQGQLDAVYNDIRYLQALCKSNPDFVAVLRSPIIKADKKGKILAAVTSANLGPITNAFNTLLMQKGREENLPEIIGAFIDQYNNIKGIKRVKITTATPLTDELKASILNQVKGDTPLEKIELETAIKEELIGGFVLQYGDTLVDASILRDLKDVRKQFLNNDYIHKLR